MNHSTSTADPYHGPQADDIFRPAARGPLSLTPGDPTGAKQGDGTRVVAEVPLGSPHRPRVRLKEDIRELIIAAAIIGATIIALRLYAAIAPPSPW